MRDSNAPTLYITDNRIAPGTIDILNDTGKIVGGITNGISNPSNLTLDEAGNLYVINRVEQTANISVYPPGKKTPALTLTRGIASPISMAANANGLYVLNDSVTGGVVSNLVHFAPGAKTVDRYRPVKFPLQVVSDASGTIYVATEGQSKPGQSGENLGGKVFELSPTGQLLRKTGRLPKPSALQFIAIDPDGTLYVLAYRPRQGNVIDEFVYVYPPGAIAPSRNFELKPRGFNVGANSAFVAPNGSLYIVDVECPNTYCTTAQASGAVLVFPRGASQPAQVVRSSAPYQFYSAAPDRAGNLYAVLGLSNPQDYYRNILEVFPKGSEHARTLLERPGLREVVVAN